MGDPENENIRQLISSRENKYIDFKQSIDFSHAKHRNGIAQDAVSFANAEGGTIIIGIEDKTGNILGIATPLDHDQIVQSITDLTEPPVGVSVDTAKIDGKLLGLIKIEQGKAVHCLRSNRRVYIRRDGINGIATPDEIVRLSDERRYSSRVYLSEPYELYSSDNRAIMHSGETLPYRKITKKGKFEHLAECPVFLPEFSRWISAPQFGDTQGSLMVSYYDPDDIKHNDFIEQVANVENQLSSLARYLECDLPVVVNWSISSHGTMCYGRGSDTLLKALDNGELGVVSITACGDFKGSNHQRSFLLLICGYCKHRKRDIVFVQDREIRLYLSSIPVSNDWIRFLFAPVLNEEIVPFSTLSYELVHPKLKVWQSAVHSNSIVPIRGIVGRYQYERGNDPIIGAAIADTRWFDPKLWKKETEWQINEDNRDQNPKERLFRNNNEITKCPIELLNECIVSLTNPVPLYSDIESRNTKGFFLPLVKHLELEVVGHNVHVLGLNATPALNPFN
jgi:hypothetical protein